MTRRARRGFALLAALVTMAIVAAFLAVAWMVVLREFRSSVGGSAAHLAMEAAEYAAVVPVERWRPGDVFTHALGGIVGPVTVRVAGGAAATWRLQRLSATTFLSQGEGAFGSARRATALFLRLGLPDFDTSAALTVRDSAHVRSGGVVAGADVIPPNWAGVGCVLAGGGAGTASPDSTTVCDGGCGVQAGVGITGGPARQADSTAADSARYTRFGGDSWSALAARASVRWPPNASVNPSPSLIGGACDRSVLTNWGDPRRSTACADYFPIIYAAGDVTITGGIGQGILLAEGDVTLAGGAEFAGVIVARDDIRSAAGGGHVYGAVLAQDRDVTDGLHPDVAAGGSIERSTCAVLRASLGTASLRRVRERSWTPIYD